MMRRVDTMNDFLDDEGTNNRGEDERIPGSRSGEVLEGQPHVVFERAKGYKKEKTVSTDFCLRGWGGNDYAREQPIQLPKWYAYQTAVSAEEFFLCENLSVTVKKDKRTTGKKGRDDGLERKRKKETPQRSRSRNSMKHSHSQVASRSIDPGPSWQSNRHVLSIVPQVMSNSAFKKYKFFEPAVRSLRSSNATAYDEMRPRYDSSGLYPFVVRPQLDKRVVVRMSGIRFRMNNLGCPVETVASVSVHMLLVRKENDARKGGTECVSNIIEIKMIPVKQGKWRPATFTKYDWIADSEKEVSLCVEVVAAIRIPTSEGTRPFAVRMTQLGMNAITLVGAHSKHDDVKPLPPGKYKLALDRMGEEEDAGASFSFVLECPTERHSNLRVDFGVPTEAARAYECMRVYIMNMFAPYSGEFLKWRTEYMYPLFFKDVSDSDVLLQYLVRLWSANSKGNEESLLGLLQQLFPAAYVLPKAGNYNLVPNADTEDTARMRVADALHGGKLAKDDRFKPFHTDELRRPLVCPLSPILG